MEELHSHLRTRHQVGECHHLEKHYSVVELEPHCKGRALPSWCLKLRERVRVVWEESRGVGTLLPPCTSTDAATFFEVMYGLVGCWIWLSQALQIQPAYDWLPKPTVGPGPCGARSPSQPGPLDMGEMVVSARLGSGERNECTNTCKSWLAV